MPKLTEQDRKHIYNQALQHAIEALGRAIAWCSHPGSIVTLHDLIKDIKGMKEEE